MYLKTTIAGFIACFSAVLSVIPLNSSARETSNSNVPLSFLENKGQIVDQNQNKRSDIDYRVIGGNVNIFIGKGQVHYQWAKSESSIARLFAENNKTKAAQSNYNIEFYRLDAVLEGANMNAPLKVEEGQSYYENYYLAHCPNGVLAHTFKKITYSNVYPAIDWVLYINDGKLKYDFVVHKGGNPRDIKIKYEGASQMLLQNDGVTITTPFGSIKEEKPYTYIVGSGQEVNSSFVLNGNVLGFDVAPYDGEMVIDPVIGWGTYYGLPNETTGDGIAASNSGNGFLSGMTSNQNSIAMFGNSHQYTYGGGSTDAYAVKFNVDGSRAWATYYGGSGFEQVFDASCDNSGNFYLAGNTTSTSAIANGGHQNSMGGGSNDAFFVKFNSGGTRVWASYYGGTGIDMINAIGADKSGNVFIAGYTASTGGIATTGAQQTSPASCYLAKFNASGTRQWGTYHGSNTGVEFIYDLAIDSSANVYIAGSSDNALLSTSGTHQATYGGNTDGFVTKFNGTGNRQWCTYYGGSQTDEARALYCDIYNNVYVGGLTYSTNTSNAIASTGAYQTTFAGFYDGFLAKLNTSNGTRVWGTYYGGTGREEITGIYAGPERKIYVAGGTTSASGISTAGNYQSTFGGAAPLGGDGDAFLVKFDFNGNRKWGTYYGGSMNESGIKMAAGGGQVYVGGYTKSESAIATSNGYLQYTAPPGPPPPFLNTAFLGQFPLDTAVYLLPMFKDTQVCLTDTFHLAYGLTSNFRPGNTFTVQLSDVNGSFANPTNVSSAATNTPGTVKYWMNDTLTPGALYRLRIVSSDIPDTTFDNGINIRVSEYPSPIPVAIFPICANGTLQLMDNGQSPPFTTFEWTGPGGFSFGGSMYNRPNVQITDSGYYVLTADNFGCIRRDSVHVTVYAKPAKPTIVSNSPVCLTDTLKINVTTPTPNVNQFNWSVSQGGTPVWYLPEIDGDTVVPISSLSDSGMYVIVAVMGGCISDPDTERVKILPKTAPTVQIGANPSVNLGPWLPVTFNVTGFSNEGANPTYQWTKNGVDIPNATNTTYTGTTGIDLQNGDTICVRMTSSNTCAIPLTATNCMVITVDLGVDDINPVGELELYPNPNNGTFYLKGKSMTDEPIDVQVMNVVGQAIYKTIINPVNRSVNEKISIPELAAGIYMVQLKSGENSTVLRFIAK